MIRKKAIAEYIQECKENGWEATAIVEELEFFVTDARQEDDIPEIKILKKGEVVHPL